MYSIVIDTNVIISALKSNKGASFKLISLLTENKFKINISVPLILEYEEIIKREINSKIINKNDIESFIDYICYIGNPTKIYYLWRPFLKDPKDDMILELAFTSNSDYIITYNLKDFSEVYSNFKIKSIIPKDFLKIIGEK